MTILTDPIQVATRCSATPAPEMPLSLSSVLSISSSIIRSYLSITSAYLFGSYAKGTADPDSDVDITLFLPDFCWEKLEDIGGVHMDLESVFSRKVDLVVCLCDDFVEKVKMYWVQINLGCGTVSHFL